MVKFTRSTFPFILPGFQGHESSLRVFQSAVSVNREVRDGGRAAVASLLLYNLFVQARHIKTGLEIAVKQVRKQSSKDMEDALKKEIGNVHFVAFEVCQFEVFLFLYELKVSLHTCVVTVSCSYIEEMSTSQLSQLLWLFNNQRWLYLDNDGVL